LADRQGGAIPPAEPLRGIAVVLAGYAVVSCADAAVKWALPEIGVVGAMVCRGVIGALVIAAIARGRGLRPRNRALLAKRSLVHTIVSGVFYLVWAAGLPLADTYAIAAVAPLLSTLLAIPLLGERVHRSRWLATAIGFAGVLVMLRPDGDLWRWEAALLLGAVAILAVTRIWMRQLAATDGAYAIAFWLMVAHIPVGLALLPFFPPAQLALGPGVLAAMLFLGASNAIAHILFARAFGLAPVSVLAPFEYSMIIWGVLLGLAIWGQVPAWSTLAGAALVIIAGLYNIVAARRARSGG
jgi:drug/metabolite transporter (DMT)-like permease